MTLLEQKLKAQQDKVRAMNSSFYKINDRMRALDNQLEQASSDLEQISSMLTKFDGYLNGTQTLSSDEKYEYGRLATEKQLSYHRRNRRAR